jgi:glutamyl-Q tRNA(Asp) synthetase
LHLGSLVAALGSFLDARSRGHRWLVRMEDLDRARLIPGSDAQILTTLETCGLTWDGAVEYQSARTELYRAALERLTAQGLTFECSCSRRQRPLDAGYPGTCRAGPTRPGPTATRFRVPDQEVLFADRAQGECRFQLAARGDVVVRRRDGAYAYQLAVVVDDALQGVTDVVRGTDLLDNTPWQIALQKALDVPIPEYLHLPLVVERSGKKLSKSRRSVALDINSVSCELCLALTVLAQEPPRILERESPGEILKWALAHWRPERLSGVREFLLAP